jgi:putative hydrolase of the HAD superfamily
MLVIPKGSMRKRKYKAIFFDAGNTLFEVYPSVGKLYAQVAETYGAVFDPQVIETHFRSEWQLRPKDYHLIEPCTQESERAWWYDLVKTIFDRCGGMQRFDEFFVELYELFASEKVWRLFPEVDEVLTACEQRGVVIGIVSNWDSRLFTICERLQLKSRFRFILASAVVGVSKPDPGIFKIALEHAQVAAEDALHIGDSWEDDVQGARAAGLDVLLLQRHNPLRRPGVALAGSLRDILEFC